MISSETKKHLIERARHAAGNAYAPYSGFHVGAAALDSEDNIFEGCNVENASYGLTCCAERVALFKAVSEKGPDAVNIKAIALISPDSEEYLSPCGACRQVIMELAPEARLFLVNNRGESRETSPAEMLPGAFHLEEK